MPFGIIKEKRIKTLPNKIKKLSMAAVMVKPVIACSLKLCLG